MLAEAIAHEEGFFVAGSLPQRNNNPGDLRHSPHSFHSGGQPNAIGKIDTPEHGWEDLNRQLAIDGQRGWTVGELIYEYAPPSENNSAAYLNYVCKFVGCSPSDLVSKVLLIKGDESWQTPKSPQPVGPGGSLPSPLPAATQSAALSPSFWSRLSSRFIPKASTTTQSPLPLVPSAPLLPVTLSQMENQGVHEMSTPNPALVAIAPSLNAVLDAVNQFGIDIGADPAKWAVTVLPAAQKLLSTVELQIPVVVTAEGGQLQGLITAKVNELKAKLAAAIAPAPAPMAEAYPATQSA
jgi:hypothetical protein